MNWAAIVWLVLILVFLLIEASTVMLVSTWFALGSLAALLLLKAWGKEETRQESLHTIGFALMTVLLMQLGLTHGAYLLFGIEDHQTLLRTLIYVAVMTVLYIVSFMFQQRWVFRTTSKERE